MSIFKGPTEEDIERKLDDRDPESVFLMGLDYQNLYLVKNAVERGADEYYPLSDALIQAVDNGNLDIVEYLVNQGADISKYNGKALNHAVKLGRLNIVKYLLNHGANVENIRSRSLDTLQVRSQRKAKKVREYINKLKRGEELK